MTGRVRIGLTVVISVCACTAACGEDEAGGFSADAAMTHASDAAVAVPASDGSVDTVLDAGAADALPCDVAAVVSARCAMCHGTSPAYGAPMKLVSAGDFVTQARDGTGLVATTLGRLHDARSPMPPTSQAPLDARELGTLETWLAAGAPAGDETCAAPDAGGDPVHALPPCDEAYEFRAHNNSAPDDSEPFEVPLKDDRYECFAFGVPWKGKRQGVRFDALIDDARVVHHWLVYGAAGTDFEEGAVYDCSGSHPNSQLLAGWAPGREPLVMPNDVGLQLPELESGHFVLEIHYNNSGAYKDARDRSGARLCTTTDLRPNEAAVHWLGTESIGLAPGSAGKALGSCSPARKATILNTWPHMHQHGRHMTTIIERAAGGQEVLVDEPFNFADQVSFDVNTQVGPGDKLRTTCSFMNDSTEQVGFGTGTRDEMCYNFVLAYPAGALSASLGFSLTGSNSTCIDLY